jgi:hypothetical protein
LPVNFVKELFKVENQIFNSWYPFLINSIHKTRFLPGSNLKKTNYPGPPSLPKGGQASENREKQFPSLLKTCLGGIQIILE